MSKAFKAASSVGAAMFVLAGSTLAAGPNLSEWSVSGGDVTTNLTCFAGYSCGNALTGNGFFQRQVTDEATGIDYFQTIITDTGATGDAGDVQVAFSDESFVVMGNSNGIKDKSYINAIDTNNNTVFEAFYATTELNTGWAAPSPSVGDQTKIWQAVVAQGGTTNTDADRFRTDFWFDQIASNNVVSSRLMRISEFVDIERGTSPSDSTQEFVLVDKLGDDFTAAGGVNNFELADGTTTNITWAQGDNIKAIWLSQDLSSMKDVYQSFGFTAYDNVTSATDDLIQTFSLSPGAHSAPEEWFVGTLPISDSGWGSFEGSLLGENGPF